MKIFYYLILIVVLVGCKDHINLRTKPSFQDKIANLEDANNKEVIVVAHRGDWRNAPENSLQAIQNCIEMGIDMVEIDVRLTKDSIPVLMHDKKLNRTTTGNGPIQKWTLDALRTLNLVDGLGVATQHKIPTLKEALALAKGKILVNLVKSYSIFDKCFEVIQETGTQNQVVIKGAKRLEEVENEFGQYLDKVYFMPIIKLPNKDAETIVNEYLNSKRPPIAFEFTIKQDAIPLVKDFKKIRKAGSSVWVNALWPHHNAGHDDEKAVQNLSVYDWFIENDIDIIQTDRPRLLLKYLREKGLHD